MLLHPWWYRYVRLRLVKACAQVLSYRALMSLGVKVDAKPELRVF